MAWSPSPHPALGSDTLCSLPADSGWARGGAQPRPSVLPDPEEHPVHRCWRVHLHCQQHYRPGLPVHVPWSTMWGITMERPGREGPWRVGMDGEESSSDLQLTSFALFPWVPRPLSHTIPRLLTHWMPSVLSPAHRIARTARPLLYPGLARLQGTPPSQCQETASVGLHDSGRLPDSHCHSLQMPPSCRAPWLCTPGRGTKWISPARCLPTPVPQSHGSEMVSCCQAPTTAISRSTTAPLPATWRWAGHGPAAGWKRQFDYRWAPECR